MFEKLAVQLARFLLKRSSLTLTQRNELCAEILDRLGALPLQSIFETNEKGELMLRGVPISEDKLIVLREYANAALDNKAINDAREQVAYKAVVGGLHTCVVPEDLYFYRAALWYHQQFQKQLEMLAQREGSSSS